MKYCVTTALERIQAMQNKVRIVQGGTSAGKTIAILLDELNEAIAQPNILTSVVADTMPALKHGAMRDFMDICNETNILSVAQWNKTESTLTLPNGSAIEFFSADSPDKVRGPKRDRNAGNDLQVIAHRTRAAAALTHPAKELPVRPERDRREDRKIARLLRGEDGRLQLEDIAHRLDDNEIGPCLGPYPHHFGETIVGGLEIKIARRLQESPRRPDVERHTRTRALRQRHTGPNDLIKSVAPVILQRVRAEGIGVDNLGARLDIRAVNRRDVIRTLDIPVFGTLPRFQAACLKLGAHAAIKPNDRHHFWETNTGSRASTVPLRTVNFTFSSFTRSACATYSP